MNSYTFMGLDDVEEGEEISSRKKSFIKRAIAYIKTRRQATQVSRNSITRYRAGAHERLVAAYFTDTTSRCKDASKSGPMQQGSFIVEPSLSTSNEPSTQGSMADLFKSNQQWNKKIIKVSHITTFEEINGADVAIPKAAVDEVREHFSNTLYGYFIGKRIPFLKTKEGME
ncbi:hypothetical protein Tco_0111738 [Tanacetum coccineum]